MHKVNPSIWEAEARETEVQGHLLQVNFNRAYMELVERQTDREGEGKRENG